MPAHWEVKKLKHIGSAQIGLTYDPTDVVGEGEGTLVLRSSNVQEGRIVFDDNVFVTKEIPQRLVTKTDDILICSRNGSRALIGKNAIIPRDASGVTFGAFMTIFRSNCNRYLFWILNSQLFEFQSGSFLTSTINQLTVGNLYGFEVLLPPIDERGFITTFLDCEAAKIDALIAEQQRLIELLKEKRQAVISNAVTKGLNPDAPMKDSGFEWLGEVPEHWEICALKRVASLKSGDTINSDSIDEVGEFPVFGGNGLRGYTSSYTHEGTYALIGRQGALCGNINYADGKFLASEHAVVVSPIKGVETSWIGELLRAMNLNQYSISAAQPGLSVEIVGNLHVPFPPRVEQACIAAFLDSETAKLDTLTAEAQRAVSLLQERRTALISAAVTGKIDVRGLVAAQTEVEQAA